MSLGADISLGGEHRGPVNSISAADMVTAFRYVFAAAAALMACAAAVHDPDGRKAAGRPGRGPRRYGGVGRGEGVPARLPLRLSIGRNSSNSGRSSQTSKSDKEPP